MVTFASPSPVTFVYSGSTAELVVIVTSTRDFERKFRLTASIVVNSFFNHSALVRLNLKVSPLVVSKVQSFCAICSLGAAAPFNSVSTDT